MTFLRDELWSTVADSWFDGGKDDPKVCILGFVPETEIILETSMTEDDIATFWKRLAAINAGLLGTQGDAARFVPKSHQLREGDATVWFITARDTDLAETAEQGHTPASYLIAEGSEGLYAVIRGELIQNNDPGTQSHNRAFHGDEIIEPKSG